MTPLSMVTDFTPDPRSLTVAAPLAQGSLFSVSLPSTGNRAADRFVGDDHNALVSWVWDHLVSDPQSSVCRAFWPLVITGPSGVGKSLLADCFARQLQTVAGGEILAASVDDFFRSSQAAGDVNAVDDWMTRRQRAAVLVLDQVSRLADFPVAEHLLCEIIDQRVESGLPTILLSLDAPSHLRLSDRLASRLSQGLWCPVHSPGPTALAALARDSFARFNVPIGESEIVALIALTPSVAVLQQLASRWLLEQGRVPFVWSAASDGLKRLLGSASPPAIKPETVLRLTAKYFQLSMKDLRGASRTMTCSRARAMAMWICRQHLKMSYQQIGTLFGYRDHTTVLSSCKKVEASLTVDAFLQTALQQLLFRLGLPPVGGK
jgi:chromosomal replication initiator protein